MSSKNPFISDPRFRLELAYDLIPAGYIKLLDYGCADGLFLSEIYKRSPRVGLYGFDADVKKLLLARKKVSQAKFIRNLNNVKKMDAVTLLDVLEHVPDEKKVLAEIHRVLLKNGLFLLSVPSKGLTQVFDPGNIKFRFPKLHRFLYEKIFCQENYQTTYCGGKLVGDISKQLKSWHRHYSLDDLKQLLGPYFKIKKVYYYGLFFPILSMLDQAYSWIVKKECKILRRLVLRDSRINYGRFSFSIFIHAVKV